jgi:beta-lactam-binding protein with PASTA domain/predicted Ser/Thr protein kinase
VIGRVFDERYEVIRKLGSGGMADVYLADDRHLGRQVALKILHARFANDAEFVERFRREASSAAGLNHPSIVQIYDRGEAEGTYYIAMEYLEGRTLKDIIIKYAPLDPDLVVSISRQVVEALRFAHRRDIIHRDIKPQNIIVDNEGRVKVTDFGIARAGSGSTMTEVGSILGTAHYLSPEQAQGQPVEAASDLYSLGVVMYEMATGKLPFNGDNPVGIAMQHVHEQPVAPRSLVPSIPANLEAVILRALGKQPVERYLTAQAMLDDLWRVQDGESVSAPAIFREDTTRVITPAAVAAASAAQPTQIRRRVPDEAPSTPEVLHGEPPRRASVWPWLLVIVLILALAGTAFAIFSSWGNAAKENGVVPGVVGMSPEDAETAIKAAGFKFKNEGKQASADVAVGLVANQSPDKDVELAKGETVTVWISSGQGQVKVPPVVGKTRQEAIDTLERLGLDWHVTEEVNDEEDAEKVLRQDPDGGVEVDAGATVELWVAVPSSMVVVPRVIGSSQAAAEGQLTGMGLVPKAELVDSTEVGGTVVGQDPPEGTEVERGATVTIKVSNAPLPDTVIVPAVGGLGLSVTQARTILTDHQLRAKIKYVETPDYPVDIVIQQSPVAGIEVPKDSYVELTVAKKPAVTTTTTPPTTTPPTTTPPTTTPPTTTPPTTTPPTTTPPDTTAPPTT